MKFAIIVMGPAGSGKSTFCEYIARFLLFRLFSLLLLLFSLQVLNRHIETKKRSVQIVNLDPAAEDLRYQPIDWCVIMIKFISNSLFQLLLFFTIYSFLLFIPIIVFVLFCFHFMM